MGETGLRRSFQRTHQQQSSYVIAAAKCFNMNNDGVKCKLCVFGFCALYIILIKRPTIDHTVCEM